MSMARNKNPAIKRGVCEEDKAPVDHEGLKGYLLVARPEKNEESLPYCPRVSTTDNQRHNVTIYVTSFFWFFLARRSFYAVVFLCGSIKHYPKPDRTYPRPLSWSHIGTLQ